MSGAHTLQVDPRLMKELKKFGAFDVSACFDCGNCTAICPLSSDKTAFPRKMITYVRLGLEGKILESPDMWLCDYCGECSRTCPRQAEPSEFMMAARRFAISKYTPTPIAKMIFSSRAFTLLFMVLAAIVPIGLFATLRAPSATSTNLFAFIPELAIHYGGIALGVVVGLCVAVGVYRMCRRISAVEKGSKEGGDSGAKGPGPKTWLRELVPTVLLDSLVQVRSEKCGTQPTTKARLTGRWFNHMMISWGFLGLLVSTALRFVAVPTNGAVVPLTEPVRLLGTVSGLLLAYGTLAMVVSRIRKSEVSTKHTLFTDWVFLALLFLAGLSGFFLEVADYAAMPLLTDAALAAHLVVVFELLVMAPFTKFAHVIYRPFAIWISKAYGRI